MEFSPIKWKNMRSTAGFLPCIEKPKILQEASLGEIYLQEIYSIIQLHLIYITNLICITNSAMYITYEKMYKWLSIRDIPAIKILFNFINIIAIISKNGC
jgi:hypothetical protein